MTRRPGRGCFRGGLDPGSRHRDAATGQEHWGAELIQPGLRLPGDAEFGFGSALVRLTRSPRGRPAGS